MSLAAKKHALPAVVAVLSALLAAGCGGADARKARHLEKGHDFFAQENYEKARIEYRNALQIVPNDSEARYENGVVDEKLGNQREAAQFYQGAIDTDADNVRARAALARLYLFSGAPEKALEIIRPSIPKHPDDAGLLIVRAAARVQLKDPGAALADAERAFELSPRSEDAIGVLAGIYKSQGDNEKAQALLENAVRQLSDTVDLRLALAQLYAALHEEPKVEAILIDLVRLKPDQKAHRIRLAQYYAGLNHIDEAERVLRQAIEALPEQRDLKIGLVEFLTQRRGRDAAAKELDAMIAANPKDYSLKLAQAAFYEQAKDFAHAEAVYVSLIAQADPDAAALTARNRLAALKIQDKHIEGAKQLLQEVLAKSPRDNDALVMSGNLALTEKDPKTAIADLRSVLRDQPNAVGVMRSLARAHLANGEPALAEETMRRAVEANPKDAAARLDLAQLLAELGKPDQAKPVIDELVKQQPDNLAALDAQFKIALQINDKSAAKTAADVMVAARPKAALGYFYQGEVAEAEKRFDDALKHYSAALDVQPEAVDPLQAYARVLVKLKRTPEALKRLDDASARYPELPFAANIKGDVLLSIPRPADAELAFRSAIERRPKWWVPYRGLAFAQASLHDEAGAAATLRAGIAIVDQPDALDAQLAGSLENAGKFNEAMQVYEAALLKNPHSDLSANNLAMLLITYKTDRLSLDRAKQLSERFSASPNPEFLDTYGWVLYKRGESEAAIAALQSALSRTPESPVSLYHLGMAQASAGQAAAARDNLARSLKAGKNFYGMGEAKATLDKLATLRPPPDGSGNGLTTAPSPKS